MRDLFRRTVLRELARSGFVHRADSPWVRDRRHRAAGDDYLGADPLGGRRTAANPLRNANVGTNAAGSNGKSTNFVRHGHDGREWARNSDIGAGPCRRDCDAASLRDPTRVRRLHDPGKDHQARKYQAQRQPLHGSIASVTIPVTGISPAKHVSAGRLCPIPLRHCTGGPAHPLIRNRHQGTKGGAHNDSSSSNVPFSG